MHFVPINTSTAKVSEGTDRNVCLFGTRWYNF